jgi:hypothetical protein
MSFMKSAIYTTAAVLLIVWLDATANAQNAQGISFAPCEVQAEGCVQIEYDRFQDKTFVTMTSIFFTIPPTEYSDNPFVRLAIGAAYSSPGTVIK